MDLGSTRWLYFFPFISLFRKAYLTLAQNVETLNSASLSIAKLNKTLPVSWSLIKILPSYKVLGAGKRKKKHLLKKSTSPHKASN